MALFITINNFYILFESYCIIPPTSFKIYRFTLLNVNLEIYSFDQKTLRYFPSASANTAIHVLH